MARTLAGAALLAVLASGGVVAWQSSRTSAGASEDPSPSTTALSTAVVERRDLASTETLDGELAYGPVSAIRLAGVGTVTWLPEPGDTIAAGSPVARVDEVPVPLLIGDVPVYRSLAHGVSDGRDVQQLEEQLVALGYAERSDSFPDEDFSSATSSALRDWQEDAGMVEDGRLDPGDVVVAAAPVRVASTVAAIGDAVAAGPLLEATGTDRQVTIDATAAQARDVAEGDTVTVEFPDGRTTPASVDTVATTVQSSTDGNGQGSTTTRQIVVTLDDAGAVADVELSPVEVLVTVESAADVLAVPVHALLASADGGYVVELVVGGQARRVPVELGAVADGWAEVTGDIAEGDEVVVPS